MGQATLERPAAESRRRVSRGPYVIRWIEANCVYPGGRWRGMPFRLLPWQRRFIIRLFEVDPASRRRMFRWCLLGVPKKNGKTALAAALACYFAIGDGEPNALVVCAAGAEKQADLVFGAAKTICEMSPTLRALTEGTRFEKEIVIPSASESKIVRLAADADTLDGPDIYVAILDELHRWKPGKGEETWDTITNGTGARLEPMIVQITTAGHDLESLCGRQYLHGRIVEETRAKAAAGEVDQAGDPVEDFDPAYYFEWHDGPEDCDHRDPDSWEAANPSYRVTVRPEFFVDQLTKKSESVFRRFFLNQWTQAADQWVETAAWKDCEDLDMPEFDPAQPLYVGLDFGHKRASCAVCMAQRLEPGEDAPPEMLLDEMGEPVVDEEGQPVHVPARPKIITRVRIWENPWPPSDPRHAKWKLQIAEVEDFLRKLRERFPEPAAAVDGEAREGPVFGYDPWRFARSAEVLEGDGLHMLEVPQTDANMVPASESWIELIQSRRLVHDGDAQYRRHVFAAEEKVTTRGSRIDRRRGSRRHNDGAISSAIATHLASEAPPAEDGGTFLWTEENAPIEDEETAEMVEV